MQGSLLWIQRWGSVLTVTVRIYTDNYPRAADMWQLLPCVHGILWYMWDNLREFIPNRWLQDCHSLQREKMLYQIWGNKASSSAVFYLQWVVGHSNHCTVSFLSSCCVSELQVALVPLRNPGWKILELKFWYIWNWWLFLWVCSSCPGPSW